MREAMSADLPPPDILSDVRDQECPGCNAMLRSTGPIRLGHSTAQLQAYAKEFAAAAVAAERERCAKLCAAMRWAPGSSPTDYLQGQNDMADKCAAAIRGQDQKGQG